MIAYVAGNDQKSARLVAAHLRDAGHFVNSSWLAEDFSLTASYGDAERARLAAKDVSEVAASDTLVLLASPHRVPGGKFVETGVALGLGKRVVVLGHRENMLMYHPSVERYDSVEDFLKHEKKEPK
jgi:nucleoside 2-deoxyribosyltransferase